MDYYQCLIEELRRELQRRGYGPYGSHDQLSESLQADDEVRGSEATTVTTGYFTAFVPRDINMVRTVEFGQAFPATQLVNQSARNYDRRLEHGR